MLSGYPDEMALVCCSAKTTCAISCPGIQLSRVPAPCLHASMLLFVLLDLAEPIGTEPLLNIGFGPSPRRSHRACWYELDSPMSVFVLIRPLLS